MARQVATAADPEPRDPMSETGLTQNEAEADILGTLIFDAETGGYASRDLLAEAATVLRPEDFYRNAFKTLFAVMLELSAQGIAPDLTVLTAEMAKREPEYSPVDLDIGIHVLASRSSNYDVSLQRIGILAKLVREAADRRRLYFLSEKLAAASGDRSMAPSETVERLQTAMGHFRVAQRGADTTIKAAMEEFREQIAGWRDAPFALRGTATGIRALDKITRGAQRTDLWLVGGRTSMGKCVAADTLIDDPTTGERVTIEQYVREQRRWVYGVTAKGELRPTAVSRWVDSGVKPVARLSTRLGRTVTSTLHHPYLTVSGWKPLYDLKVGDKIAVPATIPAFGWEHEEPALARLVAYFIAEGCLTDCSPEFTNTDPDIIADFHATITRFFPGHKVRQERITYHVSNPDGRGHGHVNQVKEWLVRFGLWGRRADEKAFPAGVWRYDRDSMVEFLRALFSCDGTIYRLAGRPRIEFAVASQALASDVQHALLRFGIVAKLWRKSERCWRVEVTAPEMVARYQREISWIGEKTSRFPGYEPELSQKRTNTGHAPAETWQIVRQDALAKGVSLQAPGVAIGDPTARMGHSSGYNPRTDSGITRDRLLRMAMILDDPGLERAASPDIYWDEIAAIELPVYPLRCFLIIETRQTVGCTTYQRLGPYSACVKMVWLFPAAYLFQNIDQALFIAAEMVVVAHIFGAVGVPPGHQVACMRLRVIEQRGEPSLCGSLGCYGGKLDFCGVVTWPSIHVYSSCGPPDPPRHGSQRDVKQ